MHITIGSCTDGYVSACTTRRKSIVIRSIGLFTKIYEQPLKGLYRKSRITDQHAITNNSELDSFVESTFNKTVQPKQLKEMMKLFPRRFANSIGRSSIKNRVAT